MKGTRARLARSLGLRILDRYTLSEFLRIFVLCVLGVPFVLIVIDLVDNLQGFLAEGASVGDIFWHYVFEFPFHSLEAFPIAALLAAVFSVARMTRDFEVTAAKAGGVSFYRLTAPLLAAGLFISGLALGLTEIVPTTNRKAAEAIGPQRVQTQSMRRDFVFRSRAGRVYDIKTLDVREGRVEEIEVERQGSGYDYPTYTALADSAVWDSTAGRWVLRNGHLHLFPARQEIVSFRFQELWQRHFTETPRELLAKPKDANHMGYRELGRYIEAIQRSGGTALKFRVDRALKIAYPFTCLIIVVFGLPLANATRRGGAPFAIGVALATTILFLMIVELFKALGSGGALHPTVAAWAPNGFFLAAGIALYTKVRT